MTKYYNDIEEELKDRITNILHKNLRIKTYEQGNEFDPNEVSIIEGKEESIKEIMNLIIDKLL